MEQQSAPVQQLDQEYLRINFHEAGFSYLLPELLELFYGQVTTYLQNIDLFLQQGELQKLAEEAHSLKGTAGSVGATPLATAAGALEQQAATADRIMLQQLATQLHQTAEETHKAIVIELTRLATEEDAALNLL